MTEAQIERRAFEEWFERSSLHEHSNWFRKDEDGDYEIPHVDTQWESWEAAVTWANAQRTEEAEGLLRAIRNLRDVKGRHNTEIACRALFALLPENTKNNDLNDRSTD